MNNKDTRGFPSQKKTRSQKSRAWAKKCVDFADDGVTLHDEGLRTSRTNKIVNANLYNGFVDGAEMTNVTDPNNLLRNNLDQIPHHPIIVPKVDLLVGEEYKRRFDYRVVVTNPDAISQKESEKKNQWTQKIQQIMESDLDEQQMEAEIKKFDKYLKYEWQDLRELRANRLVRHFYRELNLKNLFNKGFKDALIFGEEIYQCDLVAGLPHFSRLNPINVHTIRSGNSDRIEDADLIIIDEYWSPGKVIDVYHDRIKPTDIAKLEEDFTTNVSSNKHQGMLESQPDLWVEESDIDSYISIASANGHTFSKYGDQNGNVRVLRVYWRSFRKIQKVTFFDEFGDEQVDYFPEDYVPKEELGETAETLWINEWWEGVKVKDNIYMNMRPRPIQYNQLDNPSICNPGIVGEIYSTAQGKAVSLVDRMKGYQYLYDAIWDRLNKAISKNFGAIMKLDLAMIPSNWTVEKWLHFARTENLAVVDSFKEGNKGASTGKLAGGMQNHGGEMKLDMGNYIQQNIMLLNYIKTEMSDIVGVSPQREGAIENRESVGGVERSVTQSSHITEYWFARHEDVKKRALGLLMETAKVALKGKSKKMQFVAEDSSVQMMDIDGDEFVEHSYGLVVETGSELNELQNAMKELAHAGIQNDKMNFSTLLDIYMSPSLMDIKRKIEGKEDEAAEKAAQAEQNALESQERIIQQNAQTEQAKEEGEERRNIRDNETKVVIALGADDGEGAADNTVALQDQKNKLMVEMRKLDDAMKMHKDNLQIKEKEVDVKRIAANKKLASSK